MTGQSGSAEKSGREETDALKLSYEPRHLVCQKASDIVDLEVDSIVLAVETGFVIDLHQIVF